MLVFRLSIDYVLDVSFGPFPFFVFSFFLRIE